MSLVDFGERKHDWEFRPYQLWPPETRILWKGEVNSQWAVSSRRYSEEFVSEWCSGSRPSAALVVRADRPPICRAHRLVEGSVVLTPPDTWGFNWFRGPVDCLDVTEFTKGAVGLDSVKEFTVLRPSEPAAAAFREVMERAMASQQDTTAAELSSAIEHCVVDSVQPEPQPSLLVVSEAMEFIARDNPNTVQQVWEEVGVSRATLYRSFESAVGIGPARWLKLRRLNRVRSRLRLGDGISVAEAAEAEGFKHQGSFAKGYREVFGEFPRETKSRMAALTLRQTAQSAI